MNGILQHPKNKKRKIPIDFVGLHIRGGRKFTERVLAHYQGSIDATFWQRMEFYTRYDPFSKLLYGSFGNEQIFAQGIENLRQLEAEHK